MTEMNRGLVIDVRVGESISLQPSGPRTNIVVTVEPKSGQKARLRVQADHPVKVERIPTFGSPALTGTG